jgi:DNA-binding MarR family transcriptional regulator
MSMLLMDEKPERAGSFGNQLFPDGPRLTVRFAGASDQRDWLRRMAERSGLKPLENGADAMLGVANWSDLLMIDLRGQGGSDWLRGRQIGVAGLESACARLCVLVDLQSLDEAMALLDEPDTNFLCDPSDSEIISELVLASLGLGGGQARGINDVTRDQETTRLEKLSEEVRRLASTIERLTVSGDPATASEGSLRDRHSSFRAMPLEMTDLAPKPTARPWERTAGIAAEHADPSQSDIRALIRARRMRDEYFAADLFADPAWDMLLDLLAARLAGKRVSVSSLCIAAAVPPTTALRWIRQLTERDIFVRIADPLDGRRVFIALTDKAADALLKWTDAIRRKGGLLAASTRS